MVIFSEAVNILAQKLYGPSWAPPLFPYVLSELPKTRDQASDAELYYAAAILQQYEPNCKLREIPDLNDSIPSHLRRNSADLDISVGLWKKAANLVNEIFDSQIASQNELRAVLDNFAATAFAGHIRCVARDQRTGLDEEIAGRYWEIDEEALLERYWSNLIPLSGGVVHKKCLLLVDRESFPELSPDPTPDYVQREKDVREKLREAKIISERIAPHGSIGELRKVVAAYLACEIEKASTIINDETGGCWSKQGLKKSAEKQRVKQIEIVPKDRS